MREQRLHVDIKAGGPAFLFGIQFGRDEDSDRSFIEIGLILISIEISLAG